jgi:hypothetical protein
MNVCLVVKVLSQQEDLLKAYVSKLDSPFVPTVGMEFKISNSSAWLWETDNGELQPQVKKVVYNIDDETIYCLFEIDKYLNTSFWTEIKNVYNSYELMQFSIHY